MSEFFTQFLVEADKEKKSFLLGLANTLRGHQDDTAPKAEEIPTTDKSGKSVHDTAMLGSMILDHFVDDLHGAKSGTTRVVFRTSAADVANHYFENGGSFVKDLDDKTVLEIGKNLSHPAVAKGGGKLNYSIQAMPEGYKYSKLFKSPNSRHSLVLLLDIPNKFVTYLKQMAKDDNVQEARKTLTEFMNRDYYVMTLKTSASRKQASAVDDVWDDTEELLKIFDFDSVAGYKSGKLREVKDAKNLFDEKNSLKQSDDSSVSSTSEKPPVQKAAVTKPESKGSAVQTPSYTEIQDVLSNWDEVVKSFGGIDKNGRFKNQKAVPPELKKRIHSMAKAVGYDL